MSNWLLMTTRGDKHKALVRLDSVQFIREGYSGKASIGFDGEDSYTGFEESFDDVVEAIWDQPVNRGERIIKVAKEDDSDADSGESV